MMTVSIPRRAAADEKAVMGLISRRVCRLAGEYNGPWRREDSWQLDAGARWTGSVTDRRLTLWCRDDGWRGRVKEWTVASRVWLRLWVIQGLLRSGDSQ
jgi:hypothetical protein